MKKSIISLFTIFSFLIIFNSCRTVRSNRMPDFHIKNSSYQSWFVSPQNKGTDVVVVVSNVKPGVQFKSIIFRGIEVPVHKRILSNKIVLKATFSPGIAKLHYKSKINRKSNQLKYKIGNKERIILLNNLIRKKNKYFKIK